MPIIKSAMKRMRQETVRRARNNGSRQSLRTEVKALRAAVEAKDSKLAAEKLRAAQSEISKALKKNLLHKNTAARKLSSLSRLVKSAGMKPVSAAKVAVKKPAAPKAAPKKTTTKPSTKKTT
jgi:small subunit ribosomal protein S20